MASDDELFLIDGNSLAYRAFFALPDTIATSRGEPTNALFGLASMFVKILSEHDPKAVIVVWDAGLSGREKTYEPYKAERKSRPDLLREQWPHFAGIVDALGFSNVSVKGYEADDVIASLTEEAKRAGMKVMVVTGDRDAYQLPENGAVRVMTTSRGITDTKVYDRDGVIERYGIPPELVTDFIGLKGDKSDNIPGVPGIGDKTAAQLLQEYGSLDGVLDNIDNISGAKRKENLRENADLARLSKQLATLQRDIEVDIDVRQVGAEPMDRDVVREVFARWELREPLRRLEEMIDTHGTEVVSAPVEVVEAKAATLTDLKGLPEAPAALAVEPGNDGLRWAACADDAPLEGDAGSLNELLAAWGDRGLLIHDWKAVNRELGPAMGDEAGALYLESGQLTHDTMIAAYLLEPARRKYDLGELLEQSSIGTLDSDSPTAVGAAAGVWALAKTQAESLDRLELRRLFDQIELPLVDVLCAIEREGVKLDTVKLAKLAAGVDQEIAELQQAIWELAGEEFTIGSPQQLSRVLFEELGLSRKRRGKTGFSTDARVLRSIREEHEIVGKVESWRELSKLKSTYFDALPGLIDERTGRLHTTFNQAGAATGRLSSTNPNLQNIPIRTELGRKIRSCFVAEEGSVIVSADYSQVELRILAHCAGEQVLKDIFERDEDVHAATAAEVLKLDPVKVGTHERARAKAVNFGIVYGLSPHGLSEQLQIPRDEAAKYIENYMGRFPAVQKFIQDTIDTASEQGYVKTLFGRRRDIAELRSSQFQVRSQGERLAVNTVIQGTAADIIKIAMVRCDRALGEAKLKTRLVLTIHDELLFEGPQIELDQVEELVKSEMEAAAELDPPLEVDVGSGPNWLDAK